MKRIYHHYELWEDYLNGMYRVVNGREKQNILKLAIEFTGNAELYGSWMIKVADNWKFSCEQNLTDKNINQKAWIGHAACCMAIGIPEDITRNAWGFLTEQQQLDANNKADKAIEYWNEKQNITLYKTMGKQRLFDGNTRPSGFKARGNVQSAFLSNDMQSYTQERFCFD